MTDLKDYINDFGREVLEMDKVEAEQDKEARFEELLDDCMDSIKNLFGFE